MTYSTKKSAPEGTQNQVKSTTASRVLQELTDYKQVKRWALVADVGASDVRVREAIAELQLAGYPIINLQDGRGYKLAEDCEELAAYKAQERARAAKILRKVRAMTMEG